MVYFFLFFCAWNCLSQEPFEGDNFHGKGPKGKKRLMGKQHTGSKIGVRLKLKQNTIQIKYMFFLYYAQLFLENQILLNTLVLCKSTMFFNEWPSWTRREEDFLQLTTADQHNCQERFLTHLFRARLHKLVVKFFVH